MKLDKPKSWGLCALSCAFLAAAALALHLFTPGASSAEYKYTVKVILHLAFIPLLLASCLFTLLYLRQTRIWKFLTSLRGSLFFLLGGCVFIAVPFCAPSSGSLDWHYGIGLSICWIAGTAGLALGLFFLAVHLDNFVSGFLCAIGSIALVWFSGEFFYLATPQAVDGIWNNSHASKHILGGATWDDPSIETEYGRWPKRPANDAGAAAFLLMRYDRELFDAKYTFNEKNRRITPAAALPPGADLLIFGCSFAFGYGLNDEQTFAWLLARELGSSWLVENYAFPGFGAQQMLYMLNENRIDPPQAPVREALFLAIHDHLRRNSGLFGLNAVTYELQPDGSLKQGALSSSDQLFLLHTAPHFFNGSQLVRELSRSLTEKISKSRENEHAETYIAMLAESFRILKERYGATLTVLLWPDIENIASALQAKNIPVIFARDFLNDWETAGGSAYLIAPPHETHPNARAARDIAVGLAAFYKDVFSGRIQKDK